MRIVVGSVDATGTVRVWPPEQAYAQHSVGATSAIWQRLQDRVLGVDRAKHDLPALTRQLLAKADTQIIGHVKTIANEAPGMIVDQVRNVVAEAFKAQGQPVPSGFDAASMQSMTASSGASSALSALASAANRSPAIDAIVDGALRELENRDLLGGSPVSTLIALVGGAVAGTLEIIKTTKETLGGASLTLALPGFRITADKTGKYALAVSAHNPLWAKQAVQVSLSGEAFSPGQRFTAAKVSVPTTVYETQRSSVSLAPYASVSEKERRAGVEGRVKF
jgi:hypothetical protein